MKKKVIFLPNISCSESQSIFKFSGIVFCVESFNKILSLSKFFSVQLVEDP